VVAGTVAHAEPEGAPAPSGPALAVLAVLGWLRALVGLLILGVGLALLVPAFVVRAAEPAIASPLASLGVGAAELVLGPILALAVFALGLFVGGWWLGPILLGAWALALAIGLAVAGIALGRWLLLRAGRPARHPAWAALLGLTALWLIGAVPVLGGLVVLAAVLVGTGALTIALVRADRGIGQAPAQTEREPPRPVEVLRPTA
jgi:hypothetical protein